MSAVELGTILRRRFPQSDADLEADLAACEEAAWAETANPRHALKLVQMLHRRYQQLAAAAKPGEIVAHSQEIHSNPQERAS
jgi:hypothetical protein